LRPLNVPVSLFPRLIFPINHRGGSHDGFEHPTKMRAAFKSNLLGDFGDALLGSLQKSLSFFNTDTVEILRERKTGDGFKGSGKVTGTDEELLGYRFQCNIQRKVGVDKSGGVRNGSVRCADGRDREIIRLITVSGNDQKQLHYGGFQIMLVARFLGGMLLQHRTEQRFCLLLLLGVELDHVQTLFKAFKQRNIRNFFYKFFNIFLVEGDQKTVITVIGHSTGAVDIKGRDQYKISLMNMVSSVLNEIVSLSGTEVVQFISVMIVMVRHRLGGSIAFPLYVESGGIPLIHFVDRVCFKNHFITAFRNLDYHYSGIGGE